jgi:hypothetical protein
MAARRGSGWRREKCRAVTGERYLERRRPLEGSGGMWGGRGDPSVAGGGGVAVEILRSLVVVGWPWRSVVRRCHGLEGSIGLPGVRPCLADGRGEAWGSVGGFGYGIRKGE